MKLSTPTIDPLPVQPDGSRPIRAFFDSVAPRYDFLNSVLSFFFDGKWRRQACELILDGSEKTILDLGVGTGRFLSVFLERQRWSNAEGLDFSQEMLKVAQKRLPDHVGLVCGDFLDLPFKSASFDIIISSFTLRSVTKTDMRSFFECIHHLLGERGKAAFLCLTRPASIFWKLLFYPYVKWYIPAAGGLFSGNHEAYRFLSDSVMHFQRPKQTAEWMREAGFREVRLYRFSAGMATLIVGYRGY